MKILLIAVLILACCALSAAASKMDIHAMVVNDKILELADTRQLTFAEDGKVDKAVPSPDFKQIAFLAQQADGTRRLCLVSSAGGKVTTVITSPSPVHMDEIENPPKEFWRPADALNWSPNGLLLAVRATRYRFISMPDEQGAEHASLDSNEYVLVLEKNGAFKAAIPVPGGVYLFGEDLHFSPDSSTIAAACRIMQNEQQNMRDTVMGLVAFDIKEAKAKVVYTEQGGFPSIRGWYPDGQSLTWKNGPTYDGLKRIWLDGRPTEEVEGSWCEISDSPDGVFRYEPDSGEPGICLKNLQTGELMQVIRDPDRASVLTGWASNSRMFTYARQDTITDKANAREQKISTLWLAHVGASKPNAMCIALDHSWCAGVSPDFTRVAYVSDKSRLCVAELAWRDLTANEKLAAGLPLTEQDEKAIITENAKRAAVAIMMYANDWDGAYPNGESVEDDLKSYSNKENIFKRPGTDQSIFRYLIEPGTKESDITDPSTTAIGELDAGFGWKMVLYADGHVQTVPKQQ